MPEAAASPVSGVQCVVLLMWPSLRGIKMIEGRASESLSQIHFFVRP